MSYRPTPDDCREAGLFEMSDTHFLWHLDGSYTCDSVLFDFWTKDDPWLFEAESDEGSHPLVFDSRDACMEFLRTHKRG